MGKQDNILGIELVRSLFLSAPVPVILNHKPLLKRQTISVIRSDYEQCAPQLNVGSLGGCDASLNADLYTLLVFAGFVTYMLF